MWQIQIMILDVSQGFQSHQGFHSEGKLGKASVIWLKYSICDPPQENSE